MVTGKQFLPDYCQEAISAKLGIAPEPRLWRCVHQAKIDRGRVEGLIDDYGIRVSRKWMTSPMQSLRILGVSRRRKHRYKTTISAKEAFTAPDFIHCSFRAADSDRFRVGDFAYIQTSQDWLNLPGLAYVIQRLESHGSRLVEARRSARGVHPRRA